jgi:PrcB C-terminal
MCPDEKREEGMSRNSVVAIIVACAVSIAVVVVLVRVGPWEATPPPESLNFTTITKGEHSGFDQPSSKVIQDQTTWEDTWDTIMSFLLDPPPPPQVDFTNYILLAHFMGQKGSGGYEVEFSRVIEGANKITATVREISPGPECLTPAMMTEPYHVVQIPKTDKYVQFTVEKETHHCQN